MYAGIIRLMGLGSVVACTIVFASFALFAVNQTSNASERQQRAVSNEVTTEASSSKSHKSSVHKTIDEASEWLTSPFSGITAGSHSEWGIHAADLLFALIVYGFAVGYLTRALRVRI